jgi:hypothetical protein
MKKTYNYTVQYGQDESHKTEFAFFATQKEAFGFVLENDLKAFEIWENNNEFYVEGKKLLYCSRWFEADKANQKRLEYSQKRGYDISKNPQYKEVNKYFTKFFA